MVQIEREKFALVEILSPCPICWKLSPLDSLKWMEEKMIPYYPLGVIKDLTGSSEDLPKPSTKKLTLLNFFHPSETQQIPLDFFISLPTPHIHNREKHRSTFF